MKYKNINPLRFAIDTPEKVLEEARKRQEEENDLGNKNDLNGKKKTPPIRRNQRRNSKYRRSY